MFRIIYEHTRKEKRTNKQETIDIYILNDLLGLRIDWSVQKFPLYNRFDIIPRNFAIVCVCYV